MEGSDKDSYEVIVPLKGVRSEEAVEETVEETIRLLKNDPKLTVKSLQEHIGLSRRGIEYHISRLKREGKLQRIGSTKSGYWEVIDE